MARVSSTFACYCHIGFLLFLSQQSNNKSISQIYIISLGKHAVLLSKALRSFQQLRFFSGSSPGFFLLCQHLHCLWQLFVLNLFLLTAPLLYIENQESGYYKVQILSQLSFLQQGLSLTLDWLSPYSTSSRSLFLSWSMYQLKTVVSCLTTIV